MNVNWIKCIAIALFLTMVINTIGCSAGYKGYDSSKAPDINVVINPSVPGNDGAPGQDGDYTRSSGISCNVHDMTGWGGSVALPGVLAGTAPVGNFIIPNFNVPDINGSLGFPGMPASILASVGVEGYALDCYGELFIETSGVYTFKLLSDDGSRLVIEDNVVVDNQGLHAPTSVSNTVTLYRGFNKINVVYFQGPLTDIALELKYSGPNLSEQVVPSTQFTH